jgi:hypothetical protein
VHETGSCARDCSAVTVTVMGHLYKSPT